MKFSLLFPFVVILFFGWVNSASAQHREHLSGFVNDEQGRPVKSATVFISGTQRLTITGDDGYFQFAQTGRGTINLSVSMMGYMPYTQNVIIGDSIRDVRIALKPRSIMLNEVVIGSGDKWIEYYRVFVGEFLGTSKYAEDCKILNPKALGFDYNKRNGLLTAHAERFLIIENKRLGYRIRYLLKDFSYSALNNRTIYDGDTNFEEMEGTASQRKTWARNRLNAYNGSMMHFMRSVFADKVLENGFVANKLLSDIPKGSEVSDRISIDPRPLQYDSLRSPVDTTLLKLRAPVFYICYNPKKAAGLKAKASWSATDDIAIGEEGSIIKLSFNEAVLDARGSYTDYRAFLIHGFLAKNRIANLLPFEYQPLRAD